jgi:hypothetical protein
VTATAETLKNLYLVFLLISLLFALIPAHTIVISPLSSVSAIPLQTPRISGSVASTTLALDHWINLLGQDENCPPQGIIDSNGLRSYGRYCFQQDTFNRYSTQFDMSGSITDNQFQRSLVILIIQQPSGWKNWYTTVTKKIGQPPLAKSL